MNKTSVIHSDTREFRIGNLILLRLSYTLIAFVHRNLSDTFEAFGSVRIPSVHEYQTRHVTDDKSVFHEHSNKKRRHHVNLFKYTNDSHENSIAMANKTSINNAARKTKSFQGTMKNT